MSGVCPYRKCFSFSFPTAISTRTIIHFAEVIFYDSPGSRFYPWFVLSVPIKKFTTLDIEYFLPATSMVRASTFCGVASNRVILDYCSPIPTGNSGTVLLPAPSPEHSEWAVFLFLISYFSLLKNKWANVSLCFESAPQILSGGL